MEEKKLIKIKNQKKKIHPKTIKPQIKKGFQQKTEIEFHNTYSINKVCLQLKDNN